MKTSVVIPATNGNFGYLNCILRHYEDGTVKPDQLVVSISNAHLLEKSEIDALESRFSDVFDLKVIRHEKTMIQGPNRDAATSAATGDIILSNDADDIPHPQRVEVISHLFEEHDIVHLNHAYQKNNIKDFRTVEFSKIKSIHGDQLLEHHFPNHQRITSGFPRPDPRTLGFHAPYGGNLGWEIHAGCPTFRRDVFKNVKWRHNEQVAWDYDFCMDVLYRFNKSMIIDTSLIWYNLSNNRRDRADSSDLGELYKA